MGTLTVVRPMKVRKFPPVMLVEVETSSVGFLVMKLMAPPTVLRPYSVPCGPRRISTRSRSIVSNSEPGDFATYTPSTYTPTVGSSVTIGSDVIAPRMLIVTPVFPPAFV